MGLKRGFFVYFVIGLFLLPEIFASINLISLQGNVDESGVAVPYGNLTVEIYDQITGGNLLYNSTTDFYGSIVDGKYDVVLGNGSNNLDLEYGDVYYLELIINGEAFTFNGSSRQIFQSSVGKINGNFINNTQINQTHLALNLNLSNATDIRSSAVIKTTGTNFLGTALDSILDTLNQRINDVNTSATVWNVSNGLLFPEDLSYRLVLGDNTNLSNASLFLKHNNEGNSYTALLVHDAGDNEILKLLATPGGDPEYSFIVGRGDFVVTDTFGSYFDSNGGGVGIGVTPYSGINGALHVKSSGLTEVRIEGSGDTGGNLTFFDEGSYYGGIYYNPGGEFVNLRSIGDLNLISGGSVYASGNLYANGNLVNQWLYNQSTYAINYADATFLRNDGDNGTGEYNFNGGWQNDGVTIENGNLFAQTLYVYNLSSLEVSSLSVNASVLPPVDFNNSFDLGSGSRIWRNLYLGENATILGQVGIGTNNPSGDLEITDTSQTTDLIIQAGDTGEGNIARLDLEKGSIGGNTQIRFRNAGIDRTNWMFTVGQYSDDLVLYDNSEGGIFELSSEVLRIKNETGFVGIKGSTLGSINPSHELNVIGDTNITGSLYVSNNLVDRWLYNQTISVFTDSLLNSTIDARDDSNWNVTGNFLYPESLAYNISVGSTSPENKLHIKADDATTGLQIGEQADSFWTFLGSNGLVFNRAGATSYIDQQGVGGNLAFRVSESSPGDTTALILMSDGDVGIGTSSPQTNLDIWTNNSDTSLWSRFPAMQIVNQNKGTNTWEGLQFSDGDQIAAGILTRFTNPGSNYGQLYLSVRGAGGFLTNAQVIDTDGDVGLGIASPETHLHVYGAGNQRIKVESTNNQAGISLESDSGGEMIIYSPDSSNDLRIYSSTASSDVFVIEDTGEIGIGTTTPSSDIGTGYKTVIKDDAQYVLGLSTTETNGNLMLGLAQSDTRRAYIQYLNTSPENYLRIANEFGGIAFLTDDNGTESQKAVIEAGGDFGIGDTDPEYTLDITGNDDLGTFRVADTDAACVGNPESGSFSWSCSSTELIKTNITNPNFEEVKYNFLKYTSTIRKYNVIVSGEEKVGTIAEDLLRVRPDLVVEDETLLVKEYPEQEVHLIVSELIKENDLLKEELCQRDSSYSWC